MIIFTVSGRLTNVLTPYEDMVLQRGMQKSVRWQATKITPEIPSPFSFEVYQVFDFKTTCRLEPPYMFMWK